MCSLAVSTFWRWRLPLVLMAYRAREEGGFHVTCLVGGCGGAVLCALFIYSILGPSILVSFAAAGSGSCSLSIPCFCLLARVGVPLALFVPSGLWVVCLVAVVCALRWRVAPFPRSRGFPLSYHHFFLLGLPVRYSLIPLMFRSAVLAAFCSLCVLRQSPHFLRCWRPIE